MTEQQTPAADEPQGDHPIIDSTATQGDPVTPGPESTPPTTEQTRAEEELSGEATGSADGTAEEVPAGEGDTSGDTVEDTALAGFLDPQGDEVDLEPYDERDQDSGHTVRVPNVRPGAVSGLDHTPLT